MFKRSNTIEAVDPAVWDVICHENARQEDHIELIASENYASPAVTSMPKAIPASATTAVASMLTLLNSLPLIAPRSSSASRRM